MYTEQPSNDGGLAVMYTFKASDISTATNGKVWLFLPPPEALSVGSAAVRDHKPSEMSELAEG